MLFKKEKISFLDELKKTDYVVQMDNKEYYLYEAPTWELAQRIDALMGNENLGFSIDDYIVNKNINI